MADHEFDLFASARQEMIDEGFHPDFPSGVEEQLRAIKSRAGSPMDSNVLDLRSLLWSSIDNDTSRDLDQAEVAERVSGGIRVMIAIADVDADVPIGSPIDQHAAEQTTSVYTVTALSSDPVLRNRAGRSGISMFSSRSVAGSRWISTPLRQSDAC